MTVRLAVPRALPLRGEAQKLTVRIIPAEKQVCSGRIEFFAESGDDRIPIGSPRSVVVQEPTSFVHTWLPQKTGKHVLTVRFVEETTKGPSETHEASQTVFVLGRRLHFHHWHLDPALKYVTEGLLPKSASPQEWTDRGVLGQKWVGGLWAYKKKENPQNTPELLGAYWTRPCLQGHPGVVIDEFGSGGPIDEVLGQGLLEARRLLPRAYLAAYVMGVQGPLQTQGLREAADRILVEAYQSHAGYGYARIEKRYETAVAAGLEKKSLVCLGIGQALGKGRPTVTTPQELRRQLHFARYRFPRMPGVAFFGSMQPLYPALNDLVHAMFLAPVLRVAIEKPDRLLIENIGGQDAPATSISLRETKRQSIRTIPVPELDVGATHEVKLEPGNWEPVTEYRRGCFVLGPPRLWEEEPAAWRPGATDPWPAVGRVKSRFEERFEQEPRWTLQDDAFGAVFAVPPVGENAWQLECDLKMLETRHYGSFRIALVDSQEKSALELHWYRGDYEPGVYLGATVRNTKGIMVSERLAWRFQPNASYRVKVYHEPENSIRVAVLDASGASCWDTGKIPTYGRLAFDRLLLGVRVGEHSTLRWKPEAQAALLRGAANPKYVIGAELQCLRLTSFD